MRPPPEEPRLRGGVALVGLLHVFVDLGHGHVHVQVEAQEDSQQKDDKNTKGRVLVVRELDFHGPEFDAPADFRRVGRRRRLPANGIPIGGLNVFEVVRLVVVDFFHEAREHHEGVAHEEVGDVPRQQRVHPRLLESRLGRLVHLDVDVVVVPRRAVEVAPLLVGADVRGHTRVPRRLDPSLALRREILVVPLLGARAALLRRRGRRRRTTTSGAALRRGPIVDGVFDDLPAYVRVEQLASCDGRGGRQSEHDGRDHGELIVDVPRFRDVAALEGHLQAAAAHAKGHGVHLDGPPPGLLVLIQGHFYLDL
mmetsp:Transcript_32634/g.104070  ORF Transcript_32634/g.104070 Transcript_32634/m.104070 type:complete len:310 (-) Transcript_32634:745-1674(-)